MFRSRRLAAPLAAGLLGLAACAGTLHIYATPLSPAEGELLVPALLTAAEGQGYRAWRNPNGMVVELPEGVYAGWEQSMNHREFELHITLPETPEAEQAARFAATKSDHGQRSGRARSRREGRA